MGEADEGTLVGRAAKCFCADHNGTEVIGFSVRVLVPFVTQAVDETPGKTSNGEQGRGNEEREVVSEDLDQLDAQQGSTRPGNFVQDVYERIHLSEL